MSRSIVFSSLLSTAMFLVANTPILATVVLSDNRTSQVLIVQSSRIDCNPAQIENIQIEGNYAHIKLAGIPWHTLGTFNEGGNKERLAAALSAQASNRKIMIGFWSNDSNICGKEDFGTPINVLRTY
jgi:hypothetical protein